MRNLFLLIFLGACLAFSSNVKAEEIEMINRPVNSWGLTGLLFTTAPYTLATGTIEIGASVQSESSVTPDYTLTQYPLTVTMGIAKHSELAIRGTYYNLNEGPTFTAPTARKAGNVALLYKWNFFPQEAESMRPAVALILTANMPIERNSDLRINDASNWGMSIGLSSGTEIGWRDYLIGIYADGQVAGQDVSQNRLRDIYQIFNVGVLFPISKHRNLQMFLEYSIVHGKQIMTIDGGDYSAVTYGVRLVSERFNLTLGTQFLRKDVEGYDNSSRVIGLTSVKF
jgi:hypothetical protein